MAMTQNYMRELLIKTAARYEPPTPEEMAAAPVIERWSLLDTDDEDNMPAVVGIVTGHPYIGDGGVIVADEAFALDPNLGWVRTLSRLYRLGTPEKEEGSDGHS